LLSKNGNGTTENECKNQGKKLHVIVDLSEKMKAKFSHATSKTHDRDQEKG
jgi:hypothetical protein